MKKLETYFEPEAGSATIKIEKEKLKFLVVHRVKMNDYVLPKGHIKQRETQKKLSYNGDKDIVGRHLKS